MTAEQEINHLIADAVAEVARLAATMGDYPPDVMVVTNRELQQAKNHLAKLLEQLIDERLVK